MQTLYAPVKVLNFGNEWSALILLEILEERGIPYYLKRFEDRAYGKLWEPQRGWGSLWVESRDAEGVLYLYRQVLNAPTHDVDPL